MWVNAGEIVIYGGDAGEFSNVGDLTHKSMSLINVMMSYMI